MKAHTMYTPVRHQFLHKTCDKVKALGASAQRLPPFRHHFPYYDYGGIGWVLAEKMRKLVNTESGHFSSAFAVRMTVGCLTAVFSFCEPNPLPRHHSLLHLFRLVVVPAMHGEPTQEQ